MPKINRKRKIRKKREKRRVAVEDAQTLSSALRVKHLKEKKKQAGRIKTAKHISAKDKTSRHARHSPVKNQQPRAVIISPKACPAAPKPCPKADQSSLGQSVDAQNINSIPRKVYQPAPSSGAQIAISLASSLPALPSSSVKLHMSLVIFLLTKLKFTGRYQDSSAQSRDLSYNPFGNDTVSLGG